MYRVCMLFIEAGKKVCKRNVKNSISLVSYFSFENVCRRSKFERHMHEYTHIYTQTDKMENPAPVTHLSHPQISQMKSYLDATATMALPRLDQTETLLHPGSQVRGIHTSLC